MFFIIIFYEAVKPDEKQNYKDHEDGEGDEDMRRIFRIPQGAIFTLFPVSDGDGWIVKKEKERKERKIVKGSTPQSTYKIRK